MRIRVLDDEERRDWLRLSLTENVGPVTFHALMGKFGSADETRASVVQPNRLDRAAETIDVPVLLVRGRRSDLLSTEGVEDFMSRAPHTEFVDVAGAGHMVAGDRNEVFNNAILRFLDRHR